MSKHFVKYGHNMTGCGRYVDGLSYTDQPNDVTCKRPGCRVHVPKVEQPRRIALVIAPATETHCSESLTKRCPFLTLAASASPALWSCQAFPGSSYVSGDMPERLPECLPECLAAEVRS